MTLKLLLVDDNQTFVAAVRQFLDLLPGVEILGQAHDGKTALNLLRRQPVDIVLLDIAMPGMNGLELARAVQQLAVQTQIIFLSMHDNNEYRAVANELNARFVSKADFVAELLPMLELMVETKRGQSNLQDGAQGQADPQA